MSGILFKQNLAKGVQPYTPTAFEYYVGMPVAGVDEVGRGPLVGAVVTAAVILDAKNPIAGLADSKTISEKKRDVLALEIKEKALAWSLGRAEATEIDELNIFQATMLAMQRAVAGLSLTPQAIVIDGNKCPQFSQPVEAVVKGDLRVPVISAASIIAKVARDAEMVELGKLYPQYGFEQHKGYPTKQHLAAIEAHGIIAQHRRSFGPVARVVEKA